MSRKIVSVDDFSQVNLIVGWIELIAKMTKMSTCASGMVHTETSSINLFQIMGLDGLHV